jgi:cytochrome c-type biogenesis protein
MILVLGGLIAIASIAIGKVLTIFIPITDLIIIFLGVLLIAPKKPFTRLPVVRVPMMIHPFASAFVYGLLFGPLTSPCSGVMVVGIFTLSLTLNDAVGKLVLFLFFGAGVGLPLLIISFFCGWSAKMDHSIFGKISEMG